MKKPKLYRPSKSKGRKFSLEKTPAQKGYDRDWSKYRFRFLHHNPRCYACGSHKDDVKIHVDHLKNAKEFPELFDKTTNHIPLCASCHSTVTQLFEKDRKEMDFDGKMKWLHEKRKQTGTDVRVKVLPYYKR